MPTKLKTENLKLRITLVLFFTFYILGFTLASSVHAQILSIPPGSLGTTVQASVGEFYLNLSGFVSPFASIVLSSDGVLMRTTIADEKGNFSIPQVLIKEGFSHFCLDAVDFKRIGESYTCFNIPPATASVTMVDIFLPPTLGLSRTTINAGGSATAFGYTMPKAKVTLHINNKLITVYADANGYYQVSLDNLAAGNYSLYATAEYNQKQSLEPTKKLQLESLSKSQQLTHLAQSWWDQLLKFLRDWLWNPLWLVIPILILIIILIRKLWGRKFANPFRRKTHYLHHFWWMGY
jgi:hypothetical protein